MEPIIRPGDRYGRRFRSQYKVQTCDQRSEGSPCKAVIRQGRHRVLTLLLYGGGLSQHVRLLASRPATPVEMGRIEVMDSVISSDRYVCDSTPSSGLAAIRSYLRYVMEIAFIPNLAKSGRLVELTQSSSVKKTKDNTSLIRGQR